MRVLALVDDIWHPATVPVSGFEALRPVGVKVDCVTSADQWSARLMDDYPLVIVAKANNVSSVDGNPWMTESVQIAFQRYVQSGNGLLAIHAGTVGYDGAAAFRGLIGGAFREHPDPCPITIAAVPSHAVAAGAGRFTILDEHYFMDLDDRRAEVFLTTTSAHGTQPGGWTRRDGKGRVCVMTPGHNPEVWQHPAFQLLLRNAIRWCGGAA